MRKASLLIGVLVTLVGCTGRLGFSDLETRNPSGDGGSVDDGTAGGDNDGATDAETDDVDAGDIDPSDTGGDADAGDSGNGDADAGDTDTGDADGGDLDPGTPTGLWRSPSELALLPMSGAAWDDLLATANTNAAPDLTNQDDDSDSITFAKALVYGRTGDTTYADEVVAALEAIVAAQSPTWSLMAVCRSFSAYVLAADLIQLSTYDPTFDAVWRNFIDGMRTYVVESGAGSIVSTHESKPNNLGANAGASRLAISLYLEDAADVTQTLTVLRGFLGDRAAYSGFTYGELSWHCDSANPVAINPTGCTKSGHDVDGVLPDAQRQSGTFSWPPDKDSSPYSALEGLIVMAELAYRQAQDVYPWSDNALRRAVEWFYNTTFSDGQNYPASGFQQCIPFVINARYGTSLPTSSPCGNMKHIGWLDWTLQ